MNIQAVRAIYLEGIATGQATFETDAPPWADWDAAHHPFGRLVARAGGRVMALYLVVFLGTTPICAPLVGWLSGQLGPRSGVWLGGAVSVMAGLAALSYQLRADGARLRLRLRPVPRVYVARPADTV